MDDTTSQIDAGLLLAEYADTLATWARVVASTHRLTYDDALNEIQRGFVEAAGRWTPDGGASFLTFCKQRAFGAVKDYCKSTGVRAVVPIVGLPEEDAMPSALAPALDGIESAEFWNKVRGCLYRMNRRALFVLQVIHREGWTNAEVAKFMRLTPGGVSHLHSLACARLARCRSIRKWLRGERWGVRQPSRSPRSGRFKIPKGPAYSCRVIGCERPVSARGMCRAHRWQHEIRTREPGPTPFNAPVGTFRCECGAPAGGSRRCAVCAKSAYNRNTYLKRSA